MANGAVQFGGAGNAIGGFLKSFGDARRQKDKDKEEADLLKLQAKLIEQNIKAGKVKLDAATTVSDLFLGQKTPELEGAAPVPQFRNQGNLPADAGGLGLERNTMTLTQMLSDPEGLQALIQSGNLDIKDLVGAGANRDTADIRNTEALGFTRGTPEFQNELRQQLEQGADDQTLEALLLAQQEEKLALQRQKRATEEREAAEGKRGREVAVRSSFTSSKRIIELQKDLEGSALAAGIPFGQMMREGAAGLSAGLNAAGFDVTKMQDMVNKRDELVKLFADFSIEAIDRFAETGAITNQKFEALRSASPEIAKGAIANAQVLASQMQAVLDAAFVKGEEIPNRAEIEAWIKEMKSLSAQQGEPVADVAAILDMTLERLLQINPESLSAEARAAAADRYDELVRGD